MSRADDRLPLGLTASLLDRLIDPESAGTAWRQGYGVEQYSDSVRRDLEDLLNTQWSGGVPDEFPETARSVYAYGIPEIISMNAAGPDLGDRLARMLEEVIARFEPRLREIRVSPLPKGEDLLGLRFEIHARLRMDPAPEVAYLTVLKLTTGQATIQKDGA